MANFTDTAFVKSGYESPILSSQEAWVERKIMEAELELAARIGPIVEWAERQENPDDAKTRLKVVVSRMVYRVLRNPSGYDSETDGEYSYSRRSSRHEPGEVVATGNDWMFLGVSTRRRGPRSIRMSLPDDSPRNMTGGC
ncbi:MULTISPECIES: Gp19/Gp15/Gp42 family protein [unclassified Aeromicrobium]|uniref:Gp19/Gp15/Gp42 family protein n=1 Tax=unclassified Aeromicrobium TaxID=2633570 RepID=UPI00288C1443|nr:MULTISPECIES: Gp19/Gp15/Gp42 family protein [unclassified Aeromicrobium]